MFGPVYFLSGDGYPTDVHVDRELQWRLSPSFTKWTSQKDIYHPTLNSFRIDDFSRRAEHLEAYLVAQRPADDLILMGRSSGARLAALYASEHPVSAVVCLGYPFRNPTHGEQPERYRHLSKLTVPTLICQGFGDEYGGSNIFADYSLAPTTRVHLLRTDHNFKLTPDAWDALARIILEFLQDVLRRD